MAMTLDLRRPVRLRVVFLGVLVVALGLLLSWSAAPVAVHPGDQPATPANEASDTHLWSTTGCFLPGAAIDAVPGLFDFRHACIHHGGCYQGLDRGGSPAVVDRVRCDQLFRRDLEASCSEMYGSSTDRRAQECDASAKSYYAIARSFGAQYYTGSGDAG
jgi:Prokaryotic phospholipase A2